MSEFEGYNADVNEKKDVSPLQNRLKKSKSEREKRKKEKSTTKELVDQYLEREGKNERQEKYLEEDIGKSLKEVKIKKGQESNKEMVENIEDKVQASFLNRFEREGNFDTWNYILKHTAFLGLMGTLAFDGLFDMPWIGGLVGSTYGFYSTYTESRRKSINSYD